MDEQRFDALAATFAEQRSRRTVSRLLAGGALGALVAIAARDAGAAESRSSAHRRGAGHDAGAAKPKTGRRQHGRPKETAPAAADAGDAASADAKRKRRCRSSQTICAKNGQCCPRTSGYVCAWNGNAEGATVCCGVNGARCFGDYDCCNQALCVFGVCVG